MEIECMRASEADLTELVRMSEAWAAEAITFGLRANDRAYLLEKECWVARAEGAIAGYLFGGEFAARDMGAVIGDGVRCFELEELYVRPALRSRGVGAALMHHVEGELRARGVRSILLSTATKDYERILRFYVERMGMTFWTARLFKEI